MSKRILRSYPTLRAYRLAHGLSQRDAAEKFKVSQSCWARIERGRQRPSRQFTKVLMEATGVPLEVLIGVAS